MSTVGSHTGPHFLGQEFVGREAELEHLRACSGLARAGQSSVVLVEGQAGIGKTSLVRRCLVDLDDFTVLWAACDPSEMDFSFGVVNQLTARVRPTPPARLPLLAAGPKSDAAPFQVGAELIAFLDALQETGPVAMIVDDLQWADDASVRTLGFVVRRLLADRVLTILTTRSTPDGTGEDASQEWRRLIASREHGHSLRLRGLGVSEVAQLAARTGAGTLSGAAIGRLHRYTGGHPLHARTLLADVSAESLARTDMPLAAPASLAALVRRQVDGFTVDSRSLLEALAVLDGRHPLRAVASMVAVTDPARALKPLLGADLVQWWPGEPSTPVQIRHALQRDAIYQTMSPLRRHELHAAAVPLVGEEAGWAHRVAATTGNDPDLAGELERAAVAARSGDPERAATYLLWAADLSGDREERERLLLTAAAHLLLAQKYTRANPLLQAVQACAPSTLRSCVLGRFALVRGDLATAETYLTEAFDAAEGVAELRWIAMVAGGGLGLLYSWLVRGEDAIRVGERVLAIAKLDPISARLAKLAIGFGWAHTEGLRAGLRRFTEVSQLPADPADVAASDSFLLSIRGMWHVMAGEFTTGVTEVDTAVKLPKVTALFPELFLWALSYGQYMQGLWNDAAINAERALAISYDQQAASVYVHGHVTMSLVASGRGNWELAAEHVRAADEWVRTIGSREFVVNTALAAATLAQAKADHSGMLTALQPVLELPLSVGKPMVWQPWWQPLHAEALLGVGRLDEAADVLDQLDALVADTPFLGPVVAWLAGWLAQERGDPTTARARYEDGMALPVTPDEVPLHRAFLEQAYGRLLVSLHDRRATQWLRRAYGRYTALGARPFMERCGVDLASCGVRPAEKGDQATILTEREQAIAHLVARNLTNREVAKELYISVKTIEYHLSHIYAKLGVTSRRELSRAFQSHAKT